MDLGHEDGRAGAYGWSQSPGVPGTVVAAVGGDLKRDAAAGHGQGFPPGGNGRPPRPVAWREDGHTPAENDSPEARERPGALEPGPEGRGERVQKSRWHEVDPSDA